VSYVRMSCRSASTRGRNDGMNCAHALFRTFHCFPAEAVTKSRWNRVMPRVVVELGRLKGLIYSSDRGSCGRPRTFIHFMETPPVLACNPSGDQLYVLGGNYRITRQGIEG
jgi:hypothetical protein